MKNPVMGFIQNNPLTRIVVALERIADKMANADKLAVAVAKFADDFSKFSADFSKFLSNIPVESPETQNKIDTAEAAVKGFDEQVQALDALVNPVVVDPNPTPQP